MKTRFFLILTLFVFSVSVPTKGYGVIVDNPAAVFVGTWGTSDTGGYNDDYRFNAAGTGADTATWTPNLSQGCYNVYAWWKASPNRATDAPYTIYYDGGSETVDVNQEVNGNQWNLLGRYPFAAGTSGYVVLSDDAIEYVIADAIMFENLGVCYEISGQITEDGVGLDGVMVNLSGDAIDSTVTSEGGYYSFLVPNGEYTVTPSSECYEFTPPYRDVTVSSADVPDQNFDATISCWVLDNTDPEAEFVGNWGTSPSGGYLNGNYRWNAAGTGADTATWTPNLSQGCYNVYAWWKASSNRATDAPYTIYYDGGSETVDVNQEINGSQWNLLGRYPFAAGTSGYVVLSDDANEYVIADAIKFKYLGVCYEISGQITEDGVGLDGVTVELYLSGDKDPIDSTVTSEGGYYSFLVLVGNYTVTPSSECYEFTPPNRDVTVSSAGVPDQNFDATIICWVLDNPAADFVGTWGTSPTGGYNDDYRWNAAGTGADTATWTPNLPQADTYNVSAWWKANPNRATDAPYTIYYDGGSVTVEVNQEINGDQWNVLGTFPFTAGTSGYVVLSDNADEYVIADAIKFDNHPLEGTEYWDYYKQVGISDVSEEHHQKITVHYGSETDSGSDVYLGGECRPDFSDIRIKNNFNNFLDFYIITKVDENYADLIVKVPAGTISLSVYYGSPANIGEEFKISLIGDPEYFSDEDLAVSGTTDGTEAYHLKDSGTNFDDLKIETYMRAKRTSGGEASANITDVENGDLTLDADIFTSGQTYEIWSPSGNWQTDRAGQTLDDLDDWKSDMVTFDPDAYVLCGDLIKHQTKTSDQEDDLKAIRDKMINLDAPGRRIWVPGNHEFDYMSLTHWLNIMLEDTTLNYFENGVAYGSLDVGNFHIVILDSNYHIDGRHGDGETLGGPGKPIGGYIPDGEELYFECDQQQWLEDDLAATDKPTIVCLHHSLMERYWGYLCKEYDGIGHCSNRDDIRKILEDSGKVIAVLEAHTHVNRFSHHKGIPYIGANGMTTFGTWLYDFDWMATPRDELNSTDGYKVFNITINTWRKEIKVEIYEDGNIDGDPSNPSPGVVATHYTYYTWDDDYGKPSNALTTFSEGWANNFDRSTFMSGECGDWFTLGGHTSCKELVAHNADASEITIDQFEGNPNAVHMYTHSEVENSTECQIVRQIPEKTGTFKFNFRIRLKHNNKDVDFYFSDLFAGISKTHYNADHVGPIIRFASDGHVKYYNGSEWQNLPTDTTYSANVWYNFEFQIDVPSRVYNLLINGDSKGSNLSFWSSTITSLSSVSFRKNSGSNSKPLNFFVADDRAQSWIINPAAPTLGSWSAERENW